MRAVLHVPLQWSQHSVCHVLMDMSLWVLLPLLAVTLEMDHHLKVVLETLYLALVSSMCV